MAARGYEFYHRVRDFQHEKHFFFCLKKGDVL